MVDIPKRPVVDIIANTLLTQSFEYVRVHARTTKKISTCIFHAIHSSYFRVFQVRVNLYWHLAPSTPKRNGVILNQSRLTRGG